MKYRSPEIEVSFIVPVYNGEQTIRNALESTLEEKTIPIEVIVIDDGSEDGTAQILKEAAEEDSRIIVCRTENRGQGAARNLGLGRASGKYIFYLDADDTVIWAGIHDLLRKAEDGNWDIICGNYKNISGIKISDGLSGVNSGEVIRNDIPGSLYQQIKNESIFGYCWNKLYRREFLQLHQLLMPEDKSVYMEDTLYNHEVFSHNPRYYFLNVPVYNYYIRPETASHREEEKMAEKCIRTLHIWGEYMRSHQCEAENRNMFVPLAMRQFCWTIFNSAGGKNSSRKILQDQTDVFMKEEYFREMVEDRKNRQYLELVVSPAQRILYLWCFDRLNRSQYNYLTAVFMVLNPAMRLYAKSWRKI